MRHNKAKKIYSENDVLNSIVRKCTVEEDIKTRLDKYLGDRFSYYSRNKWQSIISSGLVLLNNKKAKYTRQVKKGDSICYHLIDLQEPEVATNVEILYDDGDLIIANKPANLPVIPSGKYFHNTLHSILSKQLGESLKMLNRIDRETSGCVVLSRTSKMANEYSKLLKKNKVKKYYIAIVENAIDIEKKFVVKGYMKEVGSIHYRRYQILLDEKEYKESDDDSNKYYNKKIKYSKTSFKLIKKIGNNYALLLSKLHTGRMHQIRVHLHSKNYYMLGDKVYGSLGPELFNNFVSGKLDNNKKLDSSNNFSRQALHAYKMVFIHPLTNEKIKIVAPIPADIRAFIKNNSTTF